MSTLRGALTVTVSRAAAVLKRMSVAELMRLPVDRAGYHEVIVKDFRRLRGILRSAHAPRGLKSRILRW